MDIYKSLRAGVIGTALALFGGCNPGTPDNFATASGMWDDPYTLPRQYAENNHGGSELLRFTDIDGDGRDDPYFECMDGTVIYAGSKEFEKRNLPMHGGRKTIYIWHKADLRILEGKNPGKFDVNGNEK